MTRCLVYFCGKRRGFRFGRGGVDEEKVASVLRLRLTILNDVSSKKLNTAGQLHRITTI